MLIIWTSQNEVASLDRLLRQVLPYTKTPHRVAKLDGTIPALKKGDVLLAMGGKTLDVLKAEKIIKKNAGLMSLRQTPTPLGDGHVLATYDPFMTEVDPSTEPEVLWDVLQACRLNDTGTTKPPLGDYQWVSDFNEAEQWLDAQEKMVPLSCDLETIGLDPWYKAAGDENKPDARIVTIFITHKPKMARGVYLPLDGAPPELIAQVDRILNHPKAKVVGANFKFDMLWMFVHWSIEVKKQSFDTTIVGSLLNENRSNSLNLHAKIYTAMGGYDDHLNQTYDKARMDLVPKEDLLPYAGGDTDAGLRVYLRQREELLKDKKLTRFYVDLLQPAAQVFHKMERRGVCIDMPRYKALEVEVRTELKSLEAQALSLLPARLKMKHSDNLSLGRAALLKDFMFTKAGLNLEPVQFTEKTGEPSTALEHLERFSDHPVAGPFVKTLSEYNSAAKTLSTYIVGFMQHIRSDGRFHPTYMLHRGSYGEKDDNSGTVTGRTSAKDPAYQCLKGDTLVLTDRGWLPIQSVVEGHEQGEAYRVLAHTGRWQRVIGTYRNGVQPVFSVRSDSGKLVVSTGNHPFLTKRGWVRTDNLQTGDTCYELRASHPEVHQPDVLHVGSHEEPLHEPNEQGLASVRRAGHHAGPEVAHVHGISGGHGGAPSRDHHRETGRGRALHESELHVGYAPAADVEPHEHEKHHVERGDQDGGGVGAAVRDQSWAFALQAGNWPVDGAGDDEEDPASGLCFQEGLIESVLYSGECETFDLTIEGSHSFVAAGLVVHNTIPKHTRWAKPLRSVYIPPPGYAILKMDYSQGELRVTACVAHEKGMLSVYKQGLDLHLKTGALVYGITFEEALALKKSAKKGSPDEKLVKEIRQGGKAGNFGLIYGMSAEGFVEYAWKTYGVKMEIDKATQFRDGFFDAYPALPAWHDRFRKFAKQHGYVRNPLGRLRHLPLINSRISSVRAQAERQSINSPIQSCLSDLMQLAMVELDRRYPDLWMFGMTHDDLSCYVPEDEVDLWAGRLKEVGQNLPIEHFGWEPELQFLVDTEYSTTNLAECIEM